MEFLYEDESVYVCLKPPRLLSEQTPAGDSMADFLAARNGGYIGVVHRLDRGVGGIMVYARTKKAAASLSAAIQAHRFGKEYLAAVHGNPSPDSGELRDLLFHDRTRNMSFIADRRRQGVKEAVLTYSAWEHAGQEDLTLVRVCLLTGRTHQIRVQFASRGFPLYGDGKYGAHDRSDIALFCTALSFPHPHTGQPMSFERLPTGGIWEHFACLNRE